MRMKCFRCWTTGVPPTWLVVCGALLVQVNRMLKHRCTMVVVIGPGPGLASKIHEAPFSVLSYQGVYGRPHQLNPR